MAFGSKKAPAGVSADRLSAVAGASAAPAAAAPSGVGSSARRTTLDIDPSRMRPRQIEETPEDRKRRLAAKTVNFTATIIARIVIIAGAGVYAWNQYQLTGQVHRGVAIGVFVMIGDLGRVIMKAAEPGTK